MATKNHDSDTPHASQPKAAPRAPTPASVTLNRRGVDLTDSGKYPEAIRAFTEALALSPGSAGILFNRAEAYRLSGAFAEARADLEAARAKEPEAADVLHALGLLAYEEDDFDAAETWYRKALDLDPKNAEAWNDLGVVGFRKGDYAAARERFEKAVHADRDAVEAWFNLADACDELGLARERERALASLEEARLRLGLGAEGPDTEIAWDDDEGKR